MAQPSVPSETTEQHMFAIGQNEAELIIDTRNPAELLDELETAQFLWDHQGERPWIDVDMLRGYRDTLNEYVHRGDE